MRARDSPQRRALRAPLSVHHRLDDAGQRTLAPGRRNVFSPVHDSTTLWRLARSDGGGRGVWERRRGWGWGWRDGAAPGEHGSVAGLRRGHRRGVRSACGQVQQALAPRLRRYLRRNLLQERRDGDGVHGIAARGGLQRGHTGRLPRRRRRGQGKGRLRRAFWDYLHRDQQVLGRGCRHMQDHLRGAGLFDRVGGAAQRLRLRGRSGHGVLPGQVHGPAGLQRRGEDEWYDDEVTARSRLPERARPRGDSRPGPSPTGSRSGRPLRAA